MIECWGTDGDDWVFSRRDKYGKRRTVAHVYSESVKDEILRAVNSFDAMREALQLIVAWNRSGGASSLEEARELTYRKAQAALALAKGGQ